MVLRREIMNADDERKKQDIENEKVGLEVIEKALAHVGKKLRENYQTVKKVENGWLIERWKTLRKKQRKIC